MKKELEKLDKLIAAFKIIVKEYPFAQTYETTLRGLIYDRAELVSKIGKK